MESDIQWSKYLSDLGLEVEPSGPVKLGISPQSRSRGLLDEDFPIAAVGYALIGKTQSQRRLIGYKLVDVVMARFGLDGIRIAALTTLCGTQIVTSGYDSDYDFREQIDHVIETSGLHHLFVDTEECNSHRSIRPAGRDWQAPDAPATSMSLWRDKYIRLNVPSQMMAATLLWLYRGCEDTTWLGDVSCGWLAEDAIPMLHDEGFLPVWGKLVDLYPGW